MPYGDNVNWDGSVPPAATTIIWQTDFRSPSGVQQTITASFQLPDAGSPASAVAAEMAAQWNAQNPHACPAIRVPNRDRIQFKMNGDGRQIVDMRFKVGTQPGRFTHVPYDDFVDVVPGKPPLRVGNSL